MGLFDPRPKTRREDLYDRDEELKLLCRSLHRCEPLILILGLRRCGKTSLLQVALAETRQPSIVVDCRVFEERTSVSYRELLGYVEKRILELMGVKARLSSIIQQLTVKLKLHGLEVGIGGRSPRGGELALVTLLELLNEWAEKRGTCVVIAFDEAQELAKLRGASLPNVVAYAYDNLQHLSIVMTGSMMGLVYRLLRIGDSRSPLYGRSFVEVRLRPFTREQARDFLVRGFMEHGIKLPDDLIDYAVEKLGGIPGWLTLFGHKAVTAGKPSKELVDKIVEEATDIIARELYNFLRTRSQAAKRYLTILKAVAEGFNTWTKIKRYLEVEEGKRISDSNLYLLLNNLVNASLLEKKDTTYDIPDPILKHAIATRRLRPPQPPEPW